MSCGKTIHTDGDKSEASLTRLAVNAPSFVATARIVIARAGIFKPGYLVAQRTSCSLHSVVMVDVDAESEDSSRDLGENPHPTAVCGQDAGLISCGVIEEIGHRSPTQVDLDRIAIGFAHVDHNQDGFCCR